MAKRILFGNNAKSEVFTESEYQAGNMLGISLDEVYSNTEIESYLSEETMEQTFQALQTTLITAEMLRG